MHVQMRHRECIRQHQKKKGKLKKENGFLLLHAGRLCVDDDGKQYYGDVYSTSNDSTVLSDCAHTSGPVEHDPVQEGRNLQIHVHRPHELWRMLACG